MALLNSTVSSSRSARRWVDRISKVFKNEAAIDIGNLPPVCVFQVPKALTSQNPEAYTPQMIGLGPYHHLRPELYQMERYKLAAAKEILEPEQILNFQTLVVDKLKRVDPRIRSCYNMLMDYDEDTLAWIMAIDCIFCLCLVQSFSQSHGVANNLFVDNTLFVRDIMMLENQIPVIFLKEVRRFLQLSSPEDKKDHELDSVLLQFCDLFSPLKFTIDFRDHCPKSPLHLLDLMYQLIVNDPGSSGISVKEVTAQLAALSKPLPPHQSVIMQPKAKEEEQRAINNVETILNVIDAMGPKVKPVGVVTKMPWSTISGIFRTGTKSDGDGNSSDEITIPSVSYLWRYAQVRCRPINGTINDIKFVEEKATLYLPVITLNASSEVILRNLVAYEASMSKSSLELARYINLMNGIIDTPEDVRLLKLNGVVKGDLTEEEIADLFNGMKRYFVKPDQRSHIEIAIEEVNRYYGKTVMVKLYTRIKKNAYASWKVLALISSIILFMILALQSFCYVYGCSRFWNSIGNQGGNN